MYVLALLSPEKKKSLDITKNAFCIQETKFPLRCFYSFFSKQQRFLCSCVLIYRMLFEESIGKFKLLCVFQVYTQLSQVWILSFWTLSIIILYTLFLSFISNIKLLCKEKTTLQTTLILYGAVTSHTVVLFQATVILHKTVFMIKY